MKISKIVFKTITSDKKIFKDHYDHINPIEIRTDLRRSEESLSTIITVLEKRQESIQDDQNQLKLISISFGYSELFLGQ